MECYKCKYRSTVPGSAHSSCTAIKQHPLFSKLSSGEQLQLEMVTMMKGAFPLVEVREGKQRELIGMDEWGLKNGWASWPMNFDPIWINHCSFITPKEDEVAPETKFETVKETNIAS